jgi:formate dehydrogenase major subunit
MVKLTIDGQEVWAKSGDSILSAAESANIHIPTLCHFKGQLPEASCRICLVEVSVLGGGKLVASCSTPVIQDMVINTSTDKVLRERKFILELLLSEGNHDCITCEANGECKLQELAYQYGINNTNARYPGARRERVFDDSSRFIVRDSSKCILCNKCVVACNNRGVHGILFKNNRGFATQIVSDDCLLNDSGCVACGECIQACPTGALYEKKRVGMGRSWELKKVNTTCPYCGVGCQLTVHVDERKNQPAKVTGRYVEPNDGMLCVKGRFAYDFPLSENRIESPYIRKEGKQVAVSWDEALDYTAARLREITEKYGPDSYAAVSCARSTNENNYAAMKFARLVVGTNNIDHCARACHAPTVAGLATTFGSGAMTNSIREILDAKVIFAIGTNTTEAHPVVSYYMKQAVKRGAILIVNDPRRIDLCNYAAIHVQHKVGTDVAYLNGLMNIIVNNNWHDENFIKERCENWEEMKKVIDNYPPEKVSRICGVPVELMQQVAEIISKNKPLSLCYTLGITEHTTGTDNVKSCAHLQMLLGNVGLPASGVNPLRGQNNVQGACDMGALPNVYHNYQSVTDQKVKAKFEKAWNRKGLPDKVGIKTPAMLENMIEGSIKAFFCYGENLVMVEPYMSHTKKCLEAVEFFMVADIFFNETTPYADVIFPCTSWAEEDGTYTNTERRVQRVRPFLKPHENQKEYWWIVNELGKRLGYDMGFTSSRSVWEEMRELGTMYHGITWERCEEVGVQWPCPSLDHPGTRFLHKDTFSRGKGLFSPAEWKPQAELPDNEYPFILSTGRRLWHYHTTQTRNARGIDDIFGEEYIELSFGDAEDLGIQNGDYVEVSSRRGKLKTRVWVTNRSPKGVCWMSFHFREACANVLTIDAYDTVTETAEYKACAVKIAKISSAPFEIRRERQARP